MNRWMPWLQRGANLAGVTLLWWWAAPLLPLAGSHPFELAWPRVAGLAVLAALALSIWAALQWRRRRRDAALLAGLQSGTAASEVLAERFEHAMHLLRSGLLGRRRDGAGLSGRWARRRHLYQLPWFVFIGAPGAGKTTALLHAGLRFPLAERLGSAPVAGVGGTRQCDWWFTEEAVFIDTAGRFTTQDSHASGDAAEWRTFLQLLARTRADQPINGVVVTVSVPDLLLGGDELARQAAAVDDRLQELRGQLGLSFPVYLLVTKADLLAGFVDFFGPLDTAQRTPPWGLCFEPPTAGDGAALPLDLDTQLAELVARLVGATPARVEHEPQPARRAAIYTFASQFEGLLPALSGFARRAFGHVGAAPPQWLRGIHFSSGTQEGTPIDRVLGELSRQYGMLLPPEPPRSADRGKAYFLAGLLKDLVIAEAPLAGRSLRRRAARRRRAVLAGTLLGAALLSACAGWMLSYRRNADYVAAVGTRVQQVAAQLDAASATRVDQLLPLYALLREIASNGAVDDPAHADWGFGFGLFQGPRLAQSAAQAYHRALDRTLAPLLAERLTEALRR
ncbi:MAG: type VI secretion system membrane subunit TssM, partial [Rubrivivax sp.]